jgi:membrane dipeptidase
LPTFRICPYKLSSKPFIASHSNAKALCDFHRNLTDDQLRAIGDKGGCAGVNFCPAFLTEWKDGKPSAADISDVCRQTDHMLNIAGEDCVGIGTDFDGISETPAGLEDASKLAALHNLFSVRFGRELTEKIFFKNFMRVLKL